MQPVGPAQETQHCAAVGLGDCSEGKEFGLHDRVIEDMVFALCCSSVEYVRYTRASPSRRSSSPGGKILQRPSGYLPTQIRVAFCGRLWTSDHTIVAEAIEAWLGVEPRTCVRLLGEEITYEDENIEVYCHIAADEAVPRFLLEGNMSATLAAAKVKLCALAAHCRDRGFAATAEYFEVDEEGDQVGEEFEIGLGA